MAQVGDLIEIEMGGKVQPYEVDKIVQFFPLKGEYVDHRIIVSYAGQSFAGLI